MTTKAKSKKSESEAPISPEALKRQKLHDQIVMQSSLEYEHALKYRQKRESDWHDIDDLYYGKKKKSIVTRANIHIPKMQGTVDSFLSKIDDSPYIDLEAGEEGDKPAAHRSNAMLKRHMTNGEWEMIDLLTKKEGALYGRTVVKKWATNEGGFTDYIEPVDVYDFVIDPLAGGIFPMKYARYMGQDNIIRSIHDLKNPKIYDQDCVKSIAKELKNDGDVDNRYKSIQKRREALGLSEAVFISEESIRLVEWYTTFRGEKWYVLFSPEHKKAVRFEPMKKVFGHNEFPFSSWAMFPRISEFWTPGIGELIKEPNIVQNILLSQMLDNNAYRNYGMIAYDIDKIINPADLTPKPMGKIAVEGNPKDAVHSIAPPPIEQGVSMFRLVENIFAQETGVTANAKGMPNSKRMSATEFAGLLDEVADRFFTSNKTYKFHLRRLTQLWMLGIAHNMTKPQSVKILGAKGIEYQKLKVDDVKKEFDIVISTGAEQEANKNIARDRMAEYRKRNAKNERLNQRFLDEKEARMMGFDDGEIQRLLNPEIEGDWEILAEAAAENEMLLNGEVEPNRGSTSGHIQKHLDFARSTNGLSEEQRARILLHARREIPLAAKNEEMRARKMVDEQKAGQQGAGNGDGGQPAPTSPRPPAAPQAPNGVQLRQGAPSVPPAGALPINPVEQVRRSAAEAAPPNINR